jgi:hypothetical protein
MTVTSGNEPEPEPAAPKKFSTKQITLENFTGEVKEGSLDTGAGDWLKRLSIQIRLGEMLDAKVWPDSIKMMVVAAHLECVASTWFMRKFDTLQEMSFSELCSALREQYRCPLDRLEISAALGRTVKRANESYADFAHRLNTIAATMNDGEESKSTAEDALATFVKNAWPQHRASLLSCVHMQSDNPWREMEGAVKYLTKVAGHDGRRRYSTTGAAPLQDKPAPTKRNEPSTPSASNRRMKAPRRDFSSAVCDTCHRRGHTTGYHYQWVARQGNVVHARLAAIATSMPPDEEEEKRPANEAGEGASAGHDGHGMSE